MGSRSDWSWGGIQVGRYPRHLALPQSRSALDELGDLLEEERRPAHQHRVTQLSRQASRSSRTFSFGPTR